MFYLSYTKLLLFPACQPSQKAIEPNMSLRSELCAERQRKEIQPVKLIKSQNGYLTQK